MEARCSYEVGGSFEAGQTPQGGWAGVFVRHLLPRAGDTPPGTWLAALSSRAFALLRTLEKSSTSEQLPGRICWSGFHHHVLGSAACDIAEAELRRFDAGLPMEPFLEEASDLPPMMRLAVRRHRELLRLVRMQMREAFGSAEHSHPACLAHRTLAELEPVMGGSFSEDLLGGSIHRELRRELTRRPGIMPAARILLDSCAAAVLDYWTGRPAGEEGRIPRPVQPLGPDLSSEFPDAYC